MRFLLIFFDDAIAAAVAADAAAAAVDVALVASFSFGYFETA